MKRIIKVVLAVLIVLFIAIQFIPRDHNESGHVAANDITRVYQVPAGVQAIFKRSCNDCHSNQTSYPWYARIQPLRMMMDGHVSEGKKELNFNEFGSCSSRKQRSKLRAIGQSLEEGSMPLPSYTLIHRKASLTAADKAALLKWVKATNDSLAKKI